MSPHYCSCTKLLPKPTTLSCRQAAEQHGKGTREPVTLSSQKLSALACVTSLNSLTAHGRRICSSQTLLIQGCPRHRCPRTPPAHGERHSANSAGHRFRLPSLCRLHHIPPEPPMLRERGCPSYPASDQSQSRFWERFSPFLLGFLSQNIHIFPSVPYFKALSLPSFLFDSKCDAFVPILSLALIL